MERIGTISLHDHRLLYEYPGSPLVLWWYQCFSLHCDFCIVCFHSMCCAQCCLRLLIVYYYTPAPRRGRGVYCFTSVHLSDRPSIIIPPLPEGGGGYTVLPLSVCPTVHLLLYPRSQKGEGGILFYLCPSIRPSKIFFVAFFSVTVNGKNLIFGHKCHIGIPYCR